MPANDESVYLMDFDNAIVRKRHCNFYGESAAIGEHPELRDEQLFFSDAMRYGYLFENGGLRFSRNFSSGGSPSEGELVDRYYGIVELENASRSVVAEIDRVERGTGDGWAVDETSASSWGGLDTEDQAARFLRFDWMFNAQHELLGCAATASEQTTVENTTMDKTDPITGCDGGAWRRLVGRFNG